MNMQERVVKVKLSNGEILNVKATVLAGEQDIGAKEISFERISGIVEGLSGDLMKALKKAKPKKASIEFGIEFGAESGQLTAILVKGTGTASLKITLGWGE